MRTTARRTPIDRRRSWTRLAALPIVGALGCVQALGAQAPSRPITRIQIVRESIFDSTEAGRWYARITNGLHATTREFVVRRELLLGLGAPYDSARAAESARNLRRLGFFRRVQLDTIAGNDGQTLRVTTKDRWTTKANAGARVSGGQTIVNLSLTEANLGGTGVSLGFRYRTEPDRTALRLALTVPRAVGGTSDLRTQIDRLTDGDITSVGLVNPFRTLADRRAFSLEGTSLDRRVLRWLEGGAAPTDSLRRVLDQARAQLGHAWRAGPAGYLRSDVTFAIRREDFAPYLTGSAMAHSTFGALGTAIEASRARFHLTEGLRSTGIDEDVNLSPTVRAGLWMTPRAWGYDRSGIGSELMLQGGTLLANRRGFVFAQVGATARHAGGLDSGTVRGAATLIVRPARDHLIALYVGGGAQHRPAPGAEFDLGLTTGPRAFPVHAFTGDRMYQATVEYQRTLTRDVFGIGLASLGLATFADRGGAWFSGSGTRHGTDAGMGVRLGSPRVPSTNGLLRVDLGYRFRNDALAGRWVVSVGSGFPFEVPR
ncbi:MAG: hypothetical protein ABI877_09625 [Gemmatimonadaceae bacterium]